MAEANYWRRKEAEDAADDVAARLDRIEAKLDALCESLAADDDEGEDKHMTTLDGRAVRATGTAGESM